MSAVLAYETITVSDHEGHDVGRNLDRAAADKTLSSDELSLAIQIMTHRAGSVGIGWIIKNQQHFITCVPEHERLDLFAAHYDNPSITSIVTSFELLRFIPPLQRDEFIHEVDRRHRIPGWAWITDALQLGVSTKLLTKLLLGRLNGTLLGRDATNQFVDRFLVEGAGEVGVPKGSGDLRSTSQYTLWSLIDDDELFIRVMKACASRRPKLFFEPATTTGRYSLQERLTVRLTQREIAEVLAVAAVHFFDSFDKIPGWILDHLSDETRLWLAEHALPGSLGFVVKLIMSSLLTTSRRPIDFSKELNFQELYQRTMPTDRGELLGVFQVVYGQLAYGISHGMQMAQEIYNTLVKLLAFSGYVIGTVETGEHYGRRQFFVDYDHRQDNPNGFAVKYVLLGGEPRPAPGTLVIIDVHGQSNRYIHGGGRVVLTKFIAISGGAAA